MLLVVAHVHVYVSGFLLSSIHSDYPATLSHAHWRYTGTSTLVHYLKDDFKSVLRMLRVCLHFCFEFVDTLNFGDSYMTLFFSPPLRVVEFLNAR